MSTKSTSYNFWRLYNYNLTKYKEIRDTMIKLHAVTELGPFLSIEDADEAIKDAELKRNEYANKILEELKVLDKDLSYKVFHCFNEDKF
jgi:adenylate cyclase class IV